MSSITGESNYVFLMTTMNYKVCLTLLPSNFNNFILNSLWMIVYHNLKDYLP